MAPIKGLFPPGKEVLANYDWIDAVTATGFVVLDGINAINSTGSNRILIESNAAVRITPADTQTPLDNSDVPLWTVREGTGSGGNPAVLMDFDFDLSPFQLPRTIEGEALVRVSIVGEAAAGGIKSDEVIVTAKLRKWDGSSETEIVSVASATHDDLDANEQLASVLKLTVPKTHFKQGEQIRLTIQVSSESARHIGLAHNPLNTAGGGNIHSAAFTAGNSRLTLAVPFKLDFL